MVNAKAGNYLVNGVAFSSREKVFEQCRNIRDSYCQNFSPEPGVCWILSNEDMAFLVSVIRQLPHADEVLGCGIAAIKVCCVPTGKRHWGFAVVRPDGSERVFGFRKFGQTIKQCSDTRVNYAIRFAVKDQVIEYKEQYFDGHETAICEETGLEMTWDQCHVDHYEPTFIELKAQFFCDGMPEVFDGGLNWQIKDTELAERWAEFHRDNADLRCVLQEVNLTRPKAK